jgi:hypothetical protein
MSTRGNNRGNSRGNSRGKTAAKLQQKIAETKVKRANITEKRRGLSIETPSVKKVKRSLTQKKEPSKSAIKREERKTKEKLLSYIRESELVSWEQFDVLDPVVQFQILTGFHPNVRINIQDKGIIDYTTAREWFERASTQTQCNNVIGQFEKGTICYICGLPIYGPAECEHVLAVFKAAMYLHLYRTEFKPIVEKNPELLTDTEKRILNELKMEYKWAHRCCNQVKSDHDFVKFDGKKFVFDKVVGRRILKEILKKTISGEDICKDPLFKREIDGLRLKSGEDIEKWINQRVSILLGTDVLKKGKETPPYALGAVGNIISYLNGEDKKHGFSQITAEKNKGGFYLCSLSTALAAMDTTHFLDTLRYQQGLPPAQPEKIRQEVTKPEIIISTITELTHFLSFNWGRAMSPQEIKTFYENIFGIPIPTERDMSKVTSSSVIANFLIKSINEIEEREDFYNDLFKNMKVLMIIPNQSHDTLISDKFDASEIAGISYSSFIKLHFLLKIKQSVVFYQNKGNAVFQQFIERFNQALKFDFSRIEFFFPERADQLNYLNIFHFLLSILYTKNTVDRSETVNAIETVNAMMQIFINCIGISDYSYTANLWTTTENLESATLQFMSEYPNDETKYEYPQEYSDALKAAKILSGFTRRSRSRDRDSGDKKSIR